jgi:Fe-S-cluster containining protein
MPVPWYQSGLSFSCTRCSACCRGGPGFVFLAKDDLRRLLSRLSLDFPAFFETYCTLVNQGTGWAISLKEKKNFDCVFWSSQGCSVYEDRPVQCSTFPFWSSIMESRISWKDAGNDCPGIGQGELRSRDYIEERLWMRRSAGMILLDDEMARSPENIDADTLLGS